MLRTYLILSAVPITSMGWFNHVMGFITFLLLFHPPLVQRGRDMQGVRDALDEDEEEAALDTDQELDLDALATIMDEIELAETEAEVGAGQ